MGRARIGYAAMLEQFGPSEVVDYTVAAEQAGFSGCMAADHFQPWVPAQGQAAFVWNVMTAVGERTKGDVGPGVTCPSFRFHPAIVAQASATLAAMYPGRHWLGLGSGEALNEHVVGGYWPEVGERIARMFEAIEIIRKLFTGKEVKHAGRWYQLETTRLWTMPDAPPPIYVATAGPITARKTGELCDGIITVGAADEKISTVFEKFAEGARGAGKQGQCQRQSDHRHEHPTASGGQADGRSCTCGCVAGGSDRDHGQSPIEHPFDSNRCVKGIPLVGHMASTFRTDV